MGWFFGFKLHVAMNHKGQIMAVKITAGNTDDRDPVPDITKNLKGIIAADKGYISHTLFDELYMRGLKLLVGIRKNMKNHLMPIGEKLLLRKRFIIETLFDILKHETNLWHTRHRSRVCRSTDADDCDQAYAGLQGMKMVPEMSAISS